MLVQLSFTKVYKLGSFSHYTFLSSQKVHKNYYSVFMYLGMSIIQEKSFHSTIQTSSYLSILKLRKNQEPSDIGMYKESFY